MKAGPPRIVLAHHSEVTPVAYLSEISADLDYMPIPLREAGASLPEALDLFILLVDARTGISKEMIDVWHHYQERQFPRILLVQGIEFSESDFDDIVLIGNRVLEQFATPYLVLHDDIGQPTALISLEDNLVHDYSGSALSKYSADSELIDLVSDFQDEYSQLYRELGAEGFFQGIFAIAIPIGTTRSFGVPELNSVIEALSTH